jgi:transcriptional regulator with PAS, ATPase and Fis domain
MSQKFDEPTKDILERALSLLVALTGSGVGAVFLREESREPELCVSHRIDQLVLDRVKAAWTYGRDALECGERFDCPGGGVLLPVLVERALGAFVYLDRVGESSDNEIALVTALIRGRLTEAGDVAELPAIIGPDEREHLLLLLERNEWNIARVARILGVSRLTVYRRLGRLGVSRPGGFAAPPVLARR